MLSLLSRIFKFNPHYAIIVTILTLITAFLEGIGIALIVPIVDMLGKSGSSIPSSGIVLKIKSMLEQYGIPYTLEWVLILMIGFFVAKTLIAIVAKFLTSKLSADFTFYLQKKLFNDLLNTRYIALQKFKVGSLVSGIMNDPGAASYALNLTTNVAANFVLALLYGFILLKISVQLTFITFIISVVIFIPLNVLNKMASDIGKKRLKATDEIADRLVEMLTKIKFYFSSNQLPTHQSHFEKSLTILRSAIVRNNFFSNLYGLISQPVTIILISIIVLIAKKSGIEFSLLMLFIVSLIRVPPLLFHSQALFVEIKNLSPSFDKVSELIEYFRTNSQTEQGEQVLLSGRFEIEVKNLTYKIDSKTILDQICGKIQSGNLYFIVGESGAGKSTFVDILMGLRNEYEGNVLINNKELRELDFQSWKKNISYVTQDPIVWGDTLLNNITEYTPYDEKHFGNVTKSFGCESIIDNLEFREQTRLSNAVLNISGGQRQRIAIARAFYSDTRIVLLDEVTSALDSLTEKDLVNSIRRASRENGKTVFFITHKKDFIEDEDHIMQFDKGKLIFIGKYGEWKRN